MWCLHINCMWINHASAMFVKEYSIYHVWMEKMKSIVVPFTSQNLTNYSLLESLLWSRALGWTPVGVKLWDCQKSTSYQESSWNNATYWLEWKCQADIALCWIWRRASFKLAQCERYGSARMPLFGRYVLVDFHPFLCCGMKLCSNVWSPLQSPCSFGLISTST